MAWDAGAIVGTLGLNLSEYGEGMLQAEGIAEAFPPIVTEFIENPLLAAIGVAKEMAESFVDTFSEVANAASSLGLMADKTGDTIAHLSQLVAVGKTVGVNAEEIGNAYRFLERNASGAVDGTLPKAAAAFDRIGITGDFLREHLNDIPGLFDAVSAGLQQVPNHSDAVKDGLQTIGREGASLIPLLAMQKDKFDEIAGVMTSLGAVETEESVKKARIYKTLEAEIGAAFEGIKKAVAEPILDYFGEHAQDILPIVESLSHSLRDGIGSAMKGVGGYIEGILPLLKDLGSELVGGLGASMHTILPLFEGVLKAVLGLADAAGSIIVPLLKLVSTLLTPIIWAVQRLLDLIGLITGAFGSFLSGNVGLDTLAQQYAHPGTGGGTQIDELHVHVAPIDLDEASSQIAAKIQPGLREALEAQNGQLHAAARHGKVRRAVGGSSS